MSLNLFMEVLKGCEVMHYTTFYAFSADNFSSPLHNPAKEAETLYKTEKFSFFPPPPS